MRREGGESVGRLAFIDLLRTGYGPYRETVSIGVGHAEYTCPGMRFLDRLVSDMVRSATGYNARGLVRRIGGKNILLVGGALLAGGALAEANRRSAVPPAQTGSPGRAVPPPPPPPPLPTETTCDADVGTLPNATLYAVVRAMVAAALADGELDPSEKALIEEHLEAPAEDGGLQPEQVAQVRRDLVIPASPTELAGALPAGEDRELPLRFALLVVRADGEASERERTFLEALAAALGVDGERRAAIEAEIFPSG